MNMTRKNLLGLMAALGTLCAPAYATIRIVSITPSVSSPQPIGTPVTWTVTAQDSNPGPLTFQFNVSYQTGPFVLARDFNAGILNAGTWTSQPFVWTATGGEGKHQIQVVLKDFGSGETKSYAVPFYLTSLVSQGGPVVVPTANPLVALFSAPSCLAGSFMRVVFERLGSSDTTATNWTACHPPISVTFEIAGMYPSTTYTMHSQTATGSQVVNGSTLDFTTGALPSGITFPTFTVNIAAGPQTDVADRIILHSFVPFGSVIDVPVATDLAGNITWYYGANTSTSNPVLTRPIRNGTILTIQDGPAWNPAATEQQLLREIDLAGNTIRETNTGVIQQELLAMGATDAQACNAIARPAPVGSACLGSFHHDAIRLPNGNTAFLCDIEKIFPPGTQGNSSGLPVDIIGDIIVVVNQNWQAIWYFETFQHDSGGTQLDISRPAVLGETCAIGQQGCPPMLLLGPGIAAPANDWLHGNSLYYWPKDGSILYSSRHQDWVMKIDYNNGSGTGNILWRMGLDGDFLFNNINSDAYPWFSHQHDAGVENNGAGVLTLFDNGNTRVAPPPIGLGSGNSRGMALAVNETAMHVTPVLSVDLEVYALALGSAQLLSNGSYFFQPGITNSYDIEILPTPGTTTGTQVLNVQGQTTYRSWQMQSFYNPPIT
jgi:hypothetical protein